MSVSRRAFVRSVGRAGALGLGGLALSARGSEAAIGWAARGIQPAPAPPTLIRLDSNENPVGPLPEAVEAMKAAMAHAGRYPRFMGPGLVGDLAKLHGTLRESVVLGAGSGEILRMAVDAFTSPARGLLTALPTFESPAARARQLGRPVVESPVDPRTLQIDLDAIAGQAREAGLVFLCNPNNPTGVLHGGKAMRNCLRTLRRTAPEAVVLIDEAYHEYVDDPAYESMMSVALEEPNVVVSRTFSKAYGMAGIRLGYGVGTPATIARLAAWRLGNGVNLLALAAGRAAIAALASIAAERARNAQVREFTAKVFTDLGFVPAPSQGNFVFVDVRRDARAFQDACRARGVLVGRPFPPFDAWTRVSIGTMDEMRQAADVFRQVLGPAPTAG
jgi:histidinol-phosphate aminotransferase